MTKNDIEREKVFEAFEKAKKIFEEEIQASAKAVVFLEDYVKKFPNDTETILKLAEFYWQIREDFDKAEEYYKLTLKTSPDDKTVLEAVGYFYENIDNYSESIKYYEKLTDISPELAKAWLSLARVQVMDAELSYKQYDIRYHYEKDVLFMYKNRLEPGYRKGIQSAERALSVAKGIEKKAILWLLEILHAKCRNYEKALKYKKRLEEM
jgi:tetratricopeptide (TPR) repeat protein